MWPFATLGSSPAQYYATYAASRCMETAGMLRPPKSGLLSMTWGCTASQKSKVKSRKSKVETRLTGNGRDELRTFLACESSLF